MENQSGGDEEKRVEEVKRRTSIELTKVDFTNPRDSNLSDQPAKAAYSKPEIIYAPEKIGGPMGFLKYGLVAINALIWLLGLVITGVSIWLVVDPTLITFQTNVDTTHLRSAAYVGIVLGVLILTFGSIGCCGATKESPWLLAIYLAIAVLFVIMEAVAMGVAWSALNNKDTQNKIASLIKVGIGKRQDNPPSRYFIDLLQERLKCCGIQNSNEYDDGSEDKQLPKSCIDPNTGFVYESGCVENLMNYLKSKAALFGGIAIITLLLQVGAIVFTICLLCGIRQAKKAAY